MQLTLITGPIKSAKSLELITQATPYEIAGRRVLYVHPKRNVRDKIVRSRIGLSKPSVKVDHLKDISQGFDVLAIDEAHMFDTAEDIKALKAWLLEGKTLIISGLDMDYSGKIMKAVSGILQLAPDTHIHKNSVCEVCQSLRGTHTQIISKGKVIKKGLPQVVPEDGTYVYRAVCRTCFFS